MKQIRSSLVPVAVFILFLAMAIASTPPHHTYKAKPQPCITHKGLTYSPVLISIYISGNYNMKSLTDAQAQVPSLILDNLNAASPYKYKMADGVKPNLSLYLNYTTDNYGHYGCDIKGYVFDGDFHTWTESNYVTFDKLNDDISKTVNNYISYGWCKNCPTPCNP